MQKTITILALITIVCFKLGAADYYVSFRGSDENSGLSKEKAFKTLQHGISTLVPGDTLTVCPGEYVESVSCKLSGTKECPIVIKGESHGTAIVRGDCPLQASFSNVSGLAFTYLCHPGKNVSGVIERDSLTLYSRVHSEQAVDQMPGSYFYDAKTDSLYIHTSNSGHPAKHDLTLSGVAGKYGIHIDALSEGGRVRNVIVRDLAFTGFSQAVSGKTIREGAGLRISDPLECAVKDCVAFLNSTGIILTGSKRPSRHEETAKKQYGVDDCLIDGCIGYGNYDNNGSGASIMMNATIKNSVIQNCIAFKSDKCIRLYGGYITNCLLKNNIAFLPGDIWDKGNFTERNHIIGNISYEFDNYSSASVIKQNITRAAGPRRDVVNMASDKNLLLNKQAGDLEFSNHFADPDHLDYRLQSDSALRGSGKVPFPYSDEVFYVKPDGNDDALGTSVKTAWKSIGKASLHAAAGKTVYVLPGEYPEVLVPKYSGEKGRRVFFRRRGLGKVIVNGIRINEKSNIKIEGFTILNCSNTAVEISDSENIEIAQCVIANTPLAIDVEDVKALRVTHCTLVDNSCGIHFCDSPGSIVLNSIFSGNRHAIEIDSESLAGFWSDGNSFNSKSKPFRVASGFFLWPDKRLDLKAWRSKYKLDLHSQSLIPEFSDPEKGDFYLKNAWAFNGRGTLAMPIGPYERIKKASLEKCNDIKLHSLTSTTANIQWLTPGALSNSELLWGETPKCKNQLGLDIDYLLPLSERLSHFYSLVKLKPGKTYYYKAVARVPFKTIFSNEKGEQASKSNTYKLITSKTFKFQCPLSDRPPRIFHVSPSGSNSNNGLSKEGAFKNIAFAASKMKAGDTAIIHDGVYHESIRVLATGDQKAPITFKAENPGVVFLFGKSEIKTAFELQFKHWVILDGFYIYGYAGKYVKLIGSVDITGGANNTIKRCILDGRPVVTCNNLVGKETSSLQIQNCVFRNTWNQLMLFGCGDAAIKNNVFYGNMVGCMSINNSLGKNFTLSHNIICDQVPKKRRNPLVCMNYPQTMQGGYNCFFVRPPEDKKNVYRLRHPNKTKMTAKEFQLKTGKGKTSFFANPGMTILKQYEFYKGDLTGRPHPYVTQEMNYGVGRKPILSPFQDFFASNPKCLKAKDGKIVGLNPDVFKPLKKAGKE